jgi:hypothetical protein
LLGVAAGLPALDDPAGQVTDQVRITRDDTQRRIQALIEGLSPAGSIDSGS